MSFSVVIPAYNSANTIFETLESVFGQSTPPAEVIVVDDGSTDDTAFVVNGFGTKVRLIRQANAGCGSATSTGIRNAQCEWVATLDADDLWLKEKLAVQFDWLSQHPEVELIFSQMQCFSHGDPNRVLGTPRAGWSRSTMLCQRSVFDSVGDIIDPVGGRGDMVDWLARCKEQGHVLHHLDEPLAWRRIIPGSLSYGRDRAKDAGYLEVARRAMLRRRNQR